MYQTYTGQVRNGQLLISEAVTLPEGTNLIITVLKELPTTVYDDRQSRRAAFEDFFASMAEIEDEPIDDEFDSILAKRVNISRGLDL